QPNRMKPAADVVLQDDLDALQRVPQQGRAEQRGQERLQRPCEPAGDRRVIECGLPQQGREKPERERCQALIAPVPRRAARACAHGAPARKRPAGVRRSVAANASAAPARTTAPLRRAVDLPKPMPESQKRCRRPANKWYQNAASASASTIRIGRLEKKRVVRAKASGPC